MNIRVILLLAAFFTHSLLRAAALQWEAKVDFESLFPSYIISTATLKKPTSTSPTYFGDPEGQVGCEVISPSNNCPFTVEISSSKYIRKSTMSGMLPKSGIKYRIYPDLDYDYEALYSVAEPVPETITVKLIIPNVVNEEKKKTVQVNSIHDCLYAITDSNGKIQTRAPMFAAYVNENNPLVDKILKQALDLKLVNSFQGILGSPKQAYEEVFAVWNVLQRMGIKYSTITTPSVVSKKFFSQHVRSFEDSINNTQANCVDGSVLMVSIFRKMGFNAFLVLRPGHCYCGLFLDKDNNAPLIIETTVIGSVDLSKQSITRGINSILSGRENNLSRTSFEQACAIGAKQFAEDAPNAKAKKMGYYVIDIGVARAAGIQPLKSQNPTISATSNPLPTTSSPAPSKKSVPKKGKSR